MTDSSWMLSKEIFSWIETNIPFGSNILEFGSGLGSKRLADNYHVYSIEHDENWLNLYPITYIFAPIVPNSISSSLGEIGWYDQTRIDGNIPDNVSLIIIDGPNGEIGRSGILDCIELFDWTTTILIDDIHRHAEYNMSQELSRLCRLMCVHFESNCEDGTSNMRDFGVFRKRNEVETHE